MEGVVLFADDHIFSADRPECALYEELRKTTPVLGMDNLKFVEQSTKAIGSFRAIILDWQFSNRENFEDIAEEINLKQPISLGTVKENETFDFLNENEFYSLIYIFSQKDIENSEIGVKLKEKFGDRIRFKIKDDQFIKANIENIKTDILNEIGEWEKENKNLSAPIKWSEAINLSIQKVFKELSDASHNWIKHLYDSAGSDGVDPELFIIELMQLLLSENLVQNMELINTIKGEGSAEIEYELEDPSKYEKSISKLFSILSYSKLKTDAPIMTGDICIISGDFYGIIITPECDIRHIKNNVDLEFELLTFHKNDFNSYIKSKLPDNFTTYEDLNKSRKDGLKKYFNQDDPRLHFLPSFPIDNNYNSSMLIDFRLASKRIKSTDLKKFDRNFKINSPYIQQIRQRYISYIGRVGVPALSTYARVWNLKSL